MLLLDSGNLGLAVGGYASGVVLLQLQLGFSRLGLGLGGLLLCGGSTIYGCRVGIALGMGKAGINL